MGNKELKVVYNLCGIIALIMGLFTLVTTILVGTGEAASTYLAIALNLGQIIGGIFIFFVPSRITVLNKKKLGNTLIIFAGFCILNDILYMVMINTFSGVAFVVAATLAYRYKDPNATIQS